MNMITQRGVNMLNFDFSNLLQILLVPLVIGGVVAVPYVLVSKLVKALVRMMTQGRIDL